MRNEDMFDLNILNRHLSFVENLMVTSECISNLYNWVTVSILYTLLIINILYHVNIDLKFMNKEIFNTFTNKLGKIEENETFYLRVLELKN